MRGAEAPPTDAEFKPLLKACDVHDEYGERLRAMLAFCAFTGVRPGEAMALDWSDINLPALRVTISKRLYRARTDLPKSNKVRVIALTPPAGHGCWRCPSARVRCFSRKREGGSARRCCRPTGERSRRRRGSASTGTWRPSTSALTT